MKSIRSFGLISLLTVLLLISGCASAPQESIQESLSTSEPAAQEIGISEPEKESEGRLFFDEEAGIKSKDAAPSPDMLRKKSEKQSDDMDRLD